MNKKTNLWLLNGGPARPLGNLDVSGGPPSVT